MYQCSGNNTSGLNLFVRKHGLNFITDEGAPAKYMAELFVCFSHEREQPPPVKRSHFECLRITQALLERGYRVVGNSRTISKSKELKASPDLVLVDGDISKKDAAINVADAAIRHFGRIDLLVNNAGIYIPKPFTEYTPEDFELMIGTNVAGYFFITHR